MSFATPKSTEELHQLQRETTALLRKQVLALAKNKLTRGLRTEAQRRDVLDKFQTDRLIIEAAGSISEATRAEYVKRGMSLFTKALGTNCDVWTLTAERTNSKASWYAAKAALQTFLIETMRTAKGAIDDWWRLPPAERAAMQSGRMLSEHETRSKWGYDQALILLPALANALAATPHGKVPDKFGALVRGNRKAKSKSRSVTRRPSDWRERVSDELNGNNKLLYLIGCVTGCRPAELKKGEGVQVVLRADGLLELTTPGAKRGKFSGQALRTITVPADAGVAKALALLLKTDKTLSSRPLIGSVDTYRKAIARAGERAFPGEGPERRVTAYSPRHQFRADLRAGGLSREEIAQAMGHATTRSATYYGTGARTGVGAVNPSKVSATRAVKTRSPYPNSTPAKSIAAPSPKTNPQEKPKRKRRP